ncbi:uncharacterized protein [Dermacentor andersoni]|uniref:uncharacterized protein n=1 Tax=Dermacentor andersoni TaxID=34620 RepID=UPI002155ECE8|nr:uncharacterized protein LOC126544762 [Dermacentor andersoni]
MMGPFLAGVLATITYVPCAVFCQKPREVFICDYNDEQLKAVINCHCTIFPQEDLDLMIAARHRISRNITTFRLVKRYCKSLPALMYNFRTIIKGLARNETIELVGYMMAICQDATLYHLPLNKNDPK